MWFFQWAFASATATIISGGMAGRTKLHAYLGYTTLMVAYVYPTIVHWVWSGTPWLTTGALSGPNAGIGCVHFIRCFLFTFVVITMTASHTASCDL
jgi:Amt family ammonium transporter